jgi:hypothetical protein
MNRVSTRALTRALFRSTVANWAGGGAATPLIVLSNSSVQENQAVNTTVGTLSVINGTGTWTFTLTDNATNRFNLSGALLRTSVSLDYEASTSYSISVQATNGTDTINRSFGIDILNDTSDDLSAPAISSVTIDDTTPQVGQTLTASSVRTGNPAPTMSYQWKADGTNVGTGTTYVVQAGDLGKFITVTATATNSQGSTSLTSAGTSAVAAAPVLVTKADFVNGTYVVDDAAVLPGTIFQTEALAGAVWDATKVTAGLGLVPSYSGDFPEIIGGLRTKILNPAGTVVVVEYDTASSLTTRDLRLVLTDAWTPWDKGVGWGLIKDDGVIYDSGLATSYNDSNLLSQVTTRYRYRVAFRQTPSLFEVSINGLTVQSTSIPAGNKDVWTLMQKVAIYHDGGCRAIRSIEVLDVATTTPLATLSTLSSFAPDAITGMTVSEVSSTIAQLTFTDVFGATSYEYRTVASGGTFSGAWTALGGLKQVNIPAGVATDIEVRGVNSYTQGASSNIVTITTAVDTTAPTITSASSLSLAENNVLAHTLTANETVTWSLQAGYEDTNTFELSGNTLRLFGNGSKNYEVPDDTGTSGSNTYIAKVLATDGSGNVGEQIFTLTITDVVEGSEDADALAYLSAQTTAPSSGERALVDALVKGLKADGDWDKFDFIILPAETQQAALLNLKTPSQAAFAVNTPTFTPNRGFTGDGVASHVDFGEAFNAAGNVFAAADATLGVWVNQQSATAGVKVNIGSSQTTRTRISTSDGGSVTSRLNDATDMSTWVTPNSRAGHFTLTRKDSTVVGKYFYHNGVLVRNDAIAGGTVATGPAYILRNGPSYSDDRVAVAYYGSGMDAAAVARVHARFNTYLTAKGAA